MTKNHNSALTKMSVTKTLIKAIFKGIVHPEMKILSSFTHPQVVQVV